MVKYFRTDDQVLYNEEKLCDGCWTQMIAPTQEECEYIAEKLMVDIEDVQAALDPEESSRIELQDGYTLILVDVPALEVRHEKQVYTTIPLGIILTQDVIVTICTEDTPVLQSFINKRVKEFSTKKRLRFVYQILYNAAANYQSNLRTIDKKRTEIEERVGKDILYTKYIILLCITFAVVTISHMLDETKRLEQETKVQSMMQELKYLRAQINPHFLFNALNCIYSLTLTKDEKAPDSVMKLSEMLRFVIDDCRADRVPIAREVAYIRNYIDFQKIRMENVPNLTFDCKIQNNSMEIPPMVFQPMVENCFKHSRIIDDHNAFIRISLLQEDKRVVFETENSKHLNQYQQEDDERTGIGINNVRQRLNLIFGDDYSFEISETECVYKTKLIINV